MSCLEKQPMSRKASMKHPSNLDSFMDETDQEVMSLTDRAFKSLCIGDEAIYNDSELLPSPVDCHKPKAEDRPKKPGENTASDVKKHGAHCPNGMYNTAWQMNKNASKVSSFFAAFTAKKDKDKTKVINGESWDKSALLSIQSELSELSSDSRKRLMNEHKSYRKPSEKGTGDKSSQDKSNSSERSRKNQQTSKSTNLKKLNSKNLFLHSEFSPFQSWGDLNKFGMENMDMSQCNSPSGLYDSTLYRDLKNSNRLHVPEPNKRETSQSASPLDPQQKPNSPQCTAQTLKPEPPMSLANVPKPPEIQIETLQPQVQMSAGPVQRCQSEGDLYAPWRKGQSKAKCVVQPLICSPACEKSNTGDVVKRQTDIRTVEEATLNSTPFSISQLLTPVIPSRQDTGTSEIILSVCSPAALNIPSPDIKREGYKSKASSLLFNLKDNRKRVKATYSPATFRGTNTAEQNKLSPLIEQDVNKNVHRSPGTTTTVQKHNAYSSTPEAGDLNDSQSSSHINSTMPDDFLGLSLLQSGNRDSPITALKSKKSPLLKATYPSLHLYRKSSPVEPDTKTTSTNVPGSHATVNYSAVPKVTKEHFLEKDAKEPQRKCHLTKPEVNYANHDYTHLNHVETAHKIQTEKTDSVALKEKIGPTVLKNRAQQKALTLSGRQNQEQLNTGGVLKVEESPNRHNECDSKETKPKHLFSAKQNNYIKNQRYVTVDFNDKECEDWQQNVIPAMRAEQRTKESNVDVHEDKGKVEYDQCVTNDAFAFNDYSIRSRREDLDICAEPGKAKNDTVSMKGNTSAKVALFTLKEQPSNMAPGSKKKSIIKDKYELATVALEKRIAERERKKQSEMKGDGIQASSQKETAGNFIPDKQGPNAVSDSTPTGQNVRIVSDTDTNRSECHVPEVKLEEPYKPEGVAKHSPSRLIYPDRSDRHGQQGDSRAIKSTANVSEFRERVRMPKSTSLNPECTDGTLIRFDDDEAALQKNKRSYKPRRERATFQSENRSMNERLRMEDTASELEEGLNNGQVKKLNFAKDEGLVEGHVSSLTENFNRKEEVPSLNVQEYQRDKLVGYPGNDTLIQKAISPKDIIGFPKFEGILTTSEADADNKELPDADSKVGMGIEESLGGDNGEKQSIQTISHDDTRNEVNVQEMVKKCEDENASECNVHDESSVKCLAEHFGKSDQPDVESEKSPILNPDDALMDEAEPSSLVNVNQLEQDYLISTGSDDTTFSCKPEESPSVNNGEERKLDMMVSCSNSTPEGKLPNSDMAVRLTKDVEKGGWIRCLIDSAHNLTPTCQSNGSSPTLGKPALFKVKDNTFSASPVTKTVRPQLHKTVAGVTQPWSPRESLSGSDRGEEDPDLFKDIVDIQSPTLPSTPIRINQPNQSSVQVVPLPSSHSTTDQEKKELTDSFIVPEEEEEWQLALNSVSEIIESCETSAGDTVEELALNTTQPESIKAPAAPRERSESACSGVENQLQSKPPAVPPKSEKALRRAMKLTTKRIQKAEAKNKGERGRSSEKGSCQKRERRHQSSDKVLSDRSYQREQSMVRGSSNQSTEENSSETTKPYSQKMETDAGRRLQHRCHSTLNNVDRNEQSCVAGKQKGNQSQHQSEFDPQKINIDCKRSGRQSEKDLPHKLYRRAHSLDRFSTGKHEQRLLNPASNPSTNGLQTHATAQTSPLRRNSFQYAYGSPANNIIPRTFPMTQRKLLQDLDSGQYFVVDMPVQVKTKTFFDPQTGRYVQLPVQSLEGSVPRAQSVEVVNAPPLMLYHGFVPVPVSTLP